MLDEVTQEKVEKIAREVINLARNKLLVNMRFLDMALSRLKSAPIPAQQTVRRLTARCTYTIRSIF